VTAPIYIRALDGTQWHRLSVVGSEHHGTGCLLGSIDVRDPVMLSTDPPADEICGGCRRDLEGKRARVPTVDIRPRTWTGEVAEIEVADTAIPRAITVEW
jgi:hypothetical protein